jgi:3-hydroxy-3-methylglutaryl CoA synthase
VDAPLSVASYLDLVELAWENFRLAHLRSNRPTSRSNGDLNFWRHFDYVAYHTPFISLIERAHQLLLEGENHELAAEVAAAHFEKMVGPSLGYIRELGNIYSGSIFVALAGLIENAPILEPTTRIGAFAYGSGACAEFFSGFAGKEARKVIGTHYLHDKLVARRQLNMAEYERVALAVEQSLMACDYEVDWSLLPGHYEQHYQDKNLLVLQHVCNHYRIYSWS